MEVSEEDGCGGDCRGRSIEGWSVGGNDAEARGRSAETFDEDVEGVDKSVATI